VDSQGNTPLYLLVRNFNPVDTDNIRYFKLLKVSRHPTGSLASRLTLSCCSVTQEMISQGANVNSQNFDGEAPIHHASLAGHAPLIRCLVESVRVLLSSLLL
jgi:ankyrin repeat protein